MPLACVRHVSTRHTQSDTSTRTDAVHVVHKRHANSPHERAAQARKRGVLPSQESAPERATDMPPAHDLHWLSQTYRETASSAVSESSPQLQHAGADRPDTSAAGTAKETVKRGQEGSRFSGAGRMLSYTSPHGAQCKAHLQSDWKIEASSCSALGW